MRRRPRAVRVAVTLGGSLAVALVWLIEPFVGAALLLSFAFGLWLVRRVKERA